MELVNLLKGAEVLKIIGSKDIKVSGVSINSKNVKKGYLFCAVSGFKKDGHDFIEESINNGAAAILLDKENILKEGGINNKLNNKEITFILVKDSRKQLPIISKNFYNNPTEKLILCGVTGTNGKTTTVFLTNEIFKAAGFKTSYITTVEAGINDKKLKFERTTPESLELNDFFYKCTLENVDASFIEVSSHSIDLHRVDFLHFDYFAFTNLTQDHLDYHLTMENYFKVKERLFLPEYRNIFNGKGAVINIDDYYGRILTKETDLDLITISTLDQSADLLACNIKNSINGITMDIKLSTKAIKKAGLRNLKNSFDKFFIESNLCGTFNIYNIITAVGLGILAGVNPKSIAEGILNLKGVKGRFEKFYIKEKYVIVDYAHTPDGLKNVLETAKYLLPPNAKLICVFGCGGDRDKKKRKIMGQISAELSDISIITSDNPRSEKPEDIIDMIEEGFKLANVNKNNYLKITDRKEAIFKALSIANKNDIIVIAGKGHEDYQEFADKKIHFSDQEVVMQWAYMN